MGPQLLPRNFRVHADNEYMANCDICSKDVKCGDKKWGLSTSCLTSHLRNKHRPVYDKVLASQAQAVSDAADAAAKVPKQKTLSSFFGASKELKETALLKFIIDCGLAKSLALAVRTVPCLHLLTPELFLRYCGEGIFQGLHACARSAIQGDGRSTLRWFDIV